MPKFQNSKKTILSNQNHDSPDMDAQKERAMLEAKITFEFKDNFSSCGTVSLLTLDVCLRWIMGRMIGGKLSGPESRKWAKM